MVFLVEEKVFRAAYRFISSAHQLDSIKVLLLMTEAVNAAMVTHALLVADAAKDFFQVHLASFGGRLWLFRVSGMFCEFWKVRAPNIFLKHVSSASKVRGFALEEPAQRRCPFFFLL